MATKETLIVANGTNSNLNTRTPSTVPHGVINPPTMFISLPVSDVEQSARFYEAIGRFRGKTGQDAEDKGKNLSYCEIPSRYRHSPCHHPRGANLTLKTSAAADPSRGFVRIPEYGDAKTVAFRLPAPNASVCAMLHGPGRFGEFCRKDASDASGTRPGVAIVVDARKTTEVLLSLAAKDVAEVDAWIDSVVDAGKGKAEADPYEMKNNGADCGMYVRSWADPDGHMWECVAMVGIPGECGGTTVTVE